jgi:DNA-binding FrmR family transcriptional regulator
MSHTIREKNKLLARVRRIRGQMEAVERALEEEIGCADVLQLIASVRGATNGLMAEVLEDHIRLHVADPALDAVTRRDGADELIEVVRTYLK